MRVCKYLCICLVTLLEPQVYLKEVPSCIGYASNDKLNVATTYILITIHQ